MILYIIILNILTLAFSLFEITPWLYEVQSKCYSLTYYKNPTKYLIKTYGLLWIIGIVFLALYPIGIIFQYSYIFTIVFSILFVGLKSLMYERILNTKKKGELVYTKRLKRLIFLTLLFIILFLFLMVYFCIEHYVLAVILLPEIMPVFLYFALIILHPFERMNNQRYIDIGRKKLSTFNNLIKIGITGSFGKTGVKNILKNMLEKKYNVVATEGNFNTPLGITKSINNISTKTDIFIVEMGARHIGDIVELVGIVSPDISVLTGITSQHLETFLTEENIVAEKLKIFDSPKMKYGVMNRNGVNVLKDGVEIVGGDGDKIYAKNVECNKSGCTFVLVIDGKDYNVSTKLLGTANIDNIVTATAVALYLKVEISDILSTIENLECVPHRLQLIKNAGLTIIDDTYNANPKGVREALNVLDCFPKRRVIVTPGMVELGDMEVRENYSFGRDMVDVADLVILIGENPARHIYNGLIDGGFSKEKILRFESLSIAEKCFQELFSNGDTVMFINDLPDIYN